MSFRRFAPVVLSALLLVVAGGFVALQPAGAALVSPTLESVTPSQIVPGVNNQVVTLHGDFTSGQSEVEFTPDTGITIVGTPTTSSDQTKITVTVNVASDAPNTARDVTVTGGLLGSSSTCSKCITVGPEITSISGPIANSSEAAQFVITGKAFKAPLSIQISRSAFGFGAAESDTLLATNVQVPNSTTITATVNPFGRAPGRWKVSISQDNGGKATFGDGVTTGMQITGSKPTLASITPSRIDSSQTDKQFSLTGSGFARGMTATVTGAGVTQSKPIVIPNNPSTGKPDTTKATLFLSSTESPVNGPQTLVLQNADGQSSTNVDAICVNCNLPAPGGPPTIGSVTPQILGQGATDVQMIVTGTNFGGPVPTVSVSPNGTGTNLIDVRVTRDSTTRLTLTVSVGSTTPAGPRDLTIENPTGGSVTKADAFDVSTEFNVTGLVPPGRPQGYTGTFVINGSGFTTTPTVSINPGTDITVGAVTRDSAAKLTVPVTVGPNAATTARDVVVTMGDATRTCSGCFVVGKVPTVTSINPTAATGGAPASINALNGTNFAPGAVPTLERAGQPSIAMTEPKVESPTKISGTFDLTNAAPGEWTVRVTNVDGGTAVLPNAFEVTLAGPNLVSADPETVPQSAKDLTLRLAGTSFAPGMTVTLPNADGVSVTEVNRLSNTAADVKVTALDTARLGSRDVRVANTDGQFDVCQSCFVVVQGQQPKFFGPGITAYENFKGGAFVAAGNIDGVTSNGTEFVTAPNAGGGPHVRPYRINPANGDIGELGNGFMAYETGFTGGVRVAVGNLDGNASNGDEIITGPGPGGGPHVKMFHINNDLTVGQPFGGGFMAYEPGFTGGVSVAAIDVNGDGIDEVVTGPGAGGGPHIRVWKLGLDGRSFSEFAGWMAYDNFHGGAVVAGGNLVGEDSDKPVLEEVVTVPALGGGAHVRIFGGTGAVKREFMAFGEGDPRGYQVTAGDFDFDTIDDLAVGRNSATEVFIAQVAEPPQQFAMLVSPNPQLLGAALAVGTNLAAADVDGDGDDDLVLSPNHDFDAFVRLVRPLSS